MTNEDELLKEMVEDSLSAAPTEVSEEQKTQLSDLVQELLRVRIDLDEAKAHVARLQDRYDAIRKRDLPDLMRDSGLVSPDGKAAFTHRSGARVHLRQEVWAHVKSADQEAFFSWLRDNGHGDLIRPTVHPGTLKAFAKELLSHDAAIPPQLNTTVTSVAVIVKPKTADF